MAERTIVGVDFSGDEKDNAIWITKASFQDGILELESCDRLSKKRDEAIGELENRLIKLTPDAIVAMDFPFGLPREFVANTDFCPNANIMPDLWEAAHAKEDLSKYLNTKDCGLHNRLSKGDLKGYKKCKRNADLDIRESYSPLNTAQPNMVPMTFFGMRMLHRLWTRDNAGFRVLPIHDSRRNGPQLLEVMPGAALNAFKLPYKSYKRAINALHERQKIISTLGARSGIAIPNISQFRDHCMFSDDALDSIVATVVAAKWSRCDEFQHPTREELNDARLPLEGCIYVPRRLGAKTRRSRRQIP